MISLFFYLKKQSYFSVTVSTYLNSSTVLKFCKVFIWYVVFMRRISNELSGFCFTSQYMPSQLGLRIVQNSVQDVQRVTVAA